MLGIVKALAILFVHPSEAKAWLFASNTGPVFGGQAPIDLITSGTQDGLMLVRRYLDAWRGGLFAAPLPTEEEAPFEDEDIAIIDERWAEN